MSTLADLVHNRESQILDDWMKLQLAAVHLHDESLPVDVLKDQSRRFLHEFIDALGREDGTEAQRWESVHALLKEIALARSQQGFSPSETATFVLSLKQPLFRLLIDVESPSALSTKVWQITEVIDRLGLFVTQIFIDKREDIIEQQHEELIEISTPVVELWDGIIAMPVIGTLDSSRAQVVMEALLEAIEQYEATVVIVDITGVPAVDTQTAQHLLRAVNAAQLMGASCFISGVRPQIAQTIVHLGLDLGGVRTKSSLAGAFEVALRERKRRIVPL